MNYINNVINYIEGLDITNIIDLGLSSCYCGNNYFFITKPNNSLFCTKNIF